VRSAAVIQQMLLTGQPGESEFVARMLEHARTLLGVPYEINFPGYPHPPGSRGYGKEYPHPDFGLDCSGFVLNVLQHMDQLSQLVPVFTGCDKLSELCDTVSKQDTVPGDLVFFENTYEDPQVRYTHIGIITEAGGKRMINAREPKVIEENLETSNLFDNVHHYGRVRGMPV
jgi:cell wall-associated NlpC family hydrolase